MKINLEKLRAVLALHKNENTNLPKHQVIVPYPEKDDAKKAGVKWNSVDERHEIATDSVETHPGARYLVKNFFKLKDKVPYAVRDVLKEAGVVNVKINGEWGTYIMDHEDYLEVIASLVEIELL